MDDVYKSLLELQDLDREIDEVQRRITDLDERLEGIDAPVLELEREAEAARKRLDEMRKEQRRLERGAEEKRATLKKYEERLERVRNAREEAAARTELDLVKKAVEADEQDALEVMDQVRRADLKLDEIDEKLSAAKEELAPQHQQVLDERQEAEESLEVMRGQRDNKAVRIPEPTRRLYERLRSGRTRRALAQLTPDGACGFCFGMVPIQQQSEIRQSNSLVRCEACGMILYAEET